MSKNVSEVSEQKLKFIKFAEFRKVKRKRYGKEYIYTFAYNLYQCGHCGNFKVIRNHDVKQGTKSCGCLTRKQALKNIKYIHENNLNWNGGSVVGRKAHNKGKVLIKDFPNQRHSTGHYVSKERADAMFYGLEGELHSLQIADEWIQFDSKSVKPEYIPVVNLLKKGWTVRDIAKHLNMGESTLYRLTHIWRNGGQINWKPKTQTSKDRCKHTS